MELSTADRNVERADYLQQHLRPRKDGDAEYKSAADHADFRALAAQRSVVNSTWGRDSMIERGWLPEASHYVPIGVNLDLFYPRRDRAKDDNGGKVRILSFCRPSTPRRGARLLVEAYRQLWKRYEGRVELLTYDQAPEPGTPCTHLGKLPQSTPLTVHAVL